MHLLLALWREASRHIDLTESIVRLSALLHQRIETDLVLVRRWLPDERALETVAVGRTGSRAIPSHARTEVRPDAQRALEAWCGSGTITPGVAGDKGVLAALVPPGVRGAVLAGGLQTEGGACGALLLVRSSQQPFPPADADTLRPILEPFAVALDNHLRVHELLRLREAAVAENVALRARLHRREVVDEIVGADGTLSNVLERVAQVARTDAPVLILGETGTGKEVIARAIHTASNRRDGPVVRVNCGAIPPELIDSELFGHEKGSFTGASAQRRGWFERADGGTLFLDEIGELPLAVQVRLLRVLQDGTFERVGGHQPITTNVRVVAATHRNMEDLVYRGQFREDLWYRISVFPLYLPPLRARMQDLPALTVYFARNAGLRLGGAPLAPTDEDLALLAQYPWPGNVRELGAVIERAAILGAGHRLDVAGALGTKLLPVVERIPLFAPVAPAAPPEPVVSLDAAMAAHIRAALQQTLGRVEGRHGAARLLGINPNTLRARMRKLGIAPKDHRTA